MTAPMFVRAPSTLELLRQNGLILTDDFFAVYPVDGKNLSSENDLPISIGTRRRKHIPISRFISVTQTVWHLPGR
ncbi:MAG: hypothetical protein MZV64_58850 [Ignavibacteriales bacterium]|nr:hypothetical protein [Ignavibacteriales bacterium]